jgi:Na+-translocating ferredoxin:NAD+ oxidoreductase RnfG subunit
MVLYNPDLTIKSSKVLIYREDWGAEIASTRWLRQFIGLSSKDQIALDHDIQGISGATISCRSAVIGIKLLTDIMSRLDEKLLLE